MFGDIEARIRQTISAGADVTNLSTVSILLLLLCGLRETTCGMSTRRSARICHRKRPKPHLQPNENKSQKVGAFFNVQKHGAKTPHPPRIPPRFHHRKTTSKQSVFPQPPSKTPANAPILAHPPQQKKMYPTVKKKSANLPKNYSGRSIENDLRAASRTIPISASP